MKLKRILAKLKAYPVAVTGLLLALVIAVVGNMRSGDIIAKEDTLRTLERELNTMNSNLEKGVGIQEQSQEAVAISERIQERLIDPKDTLANLSYFYGLESESGVSMQNPRQAEFTPAGSNSFSKVSYSMQVSGSMENVLDLMLRLQSGKYLAKVTNFKISYSTSGDAGDCALSLTVQILGEKG